MCPNFLNTSHCASKKKVGDNERTILGTQVLMASTNLYDKQFLQNRDAFNENN